MKSNPVVWFEIYVQDMARAKAFYESVFQVKLEQMMPESDLEMWGFPRNEESQMGINGSLVKMKGVPSGGSTLVYFGCDDCAVEAKRIIAASGKVNREKMSIGQYGFIVLAVDTEGNMIGLHSLK